MGPVTTGSEFADAEGQTSFWSASRFAGEVFEADVLVIGGEGFFARHGLDVDLLNYSGSTDQLLEALAAGKADAAAGMALRWLKRMEQGFDVTACACSCPPIPASTTYSI